MTREDFNEYCASLPQTTHVIQWGGSDVWKVGDKLFALCGWTKDKTPGFTFKASDMAFDILQDSPGIRPAPYLASRGLKWLQVYGEPGLSDDSLKEHIKASYDMVVAKLTKAKRANLNL